MYKINISAIEFKSAVENSFSIVVKSDDNILGTIYNITTTSQILSQLDKEHWGEMMKVHIQPKNLEESPIQYDLIEVKTVLKSNSK